MADLINRAAVLRLLDENGIVFRHEIEWLPSIDAEPVVHGWWKKRKTWVGCSECSFKVNDETNYCPNCGAKMDV